ncbi:hypothetical protein RKE25_22725 (plasmid) [Dyella sp. BiH032]|uniref:hypothetical protein n=1 Tax=Dyella sp. BiH032 TaxID=3075430 RepID=UPI002892B112|nr:hypothetical protein [Dyella sp. BiH032]WNL48350.1 hypothetical protein RKE25_22725 [Dyella sp. BiH032]
MPSSTITIPSSPTTASGNELLAKARRVARTWAEILDTPSNALSNLHFVILTKPDGAVAIAQTGGHEGSVERLLGELTYAALRPFVVVSTVAVEQGGGAAAVPHIVFHLHEPTGAGAVHICRIELDGAVPALRNARVLLEGESVRVPYSIPCCLPGAGQGAAARAAGQRLH